MARRRPIQLDGVVDLATTRRPGGSGTVCVDEIHQVARTTSDNAKQRRAVDASGRLHERLIVGLRLTLTKN